RETVGITLQTFRDNRPIGFITSEKRQYLDSQKNPLFQPSTKAGIRTTPRLDAYVVLAGVRNTGSAAGDNVAELRVTFNPLVMWVWTGGFIIMIGGLIVMWPQAERRRPQSGYAAVMPPARAGVSEVAVRI